MVVNGITLHEAYMIENLRKQGVSNEELIKIDNQAIERWKELDIDFDLNVLKELAEENQAAFSSIILEGYQVKFLTLNGLINLVQLKFDKELDVDFTVHEDGISDLKLSKSHHPEMKQMLSQNWKVIEADGRLAIRSVTS